ncbi:MAG: hypothetical protein WAU32_02825, partial [Thermoanaerobaculia bacterium]
SEPGFLAPAAGDVLASGVAHEARWNSPCGARPDADEMELLLSVDGGLTFPIRLTAELPRCASAFRWKVPALSAWHARLGVRMGHEGRRETERIAFVSEEFRIASAETSPTARLVRGPSEWWTEQALLEIGPEGLLGGSLRGAPERLQSPSEDTNLEGPRHGFREAPATSETKLEPSATGVIRCAGSLPPPRRGAPLPLRE